MLGVGLGINKVGVRLQAAKELEEWKKGGEKKDDFQGRNNLMLNPDNRLTSH